MSGGPGARIGAHRCTALLLLILLQHSGRAECPPPEPRSEEELSVVVLSAGGTAFGQELAYLVGERLRNAGFPANVSSPPRECTPPSRADAAVCRDAVLGALAGGAAHAALLLLPAASPPEEGRLRDAGLDVRGALTQPVRRQCLAPPPARSLLDLADAELAAHYAAPSYDGLTEEHVSIPEWCSEKDSMCANVLVDDDGEAEVLAATVLRHRLLAKIQVRSASHALSSSNHTSPVICMWTSTTFVAPLGYRVLAPPPCDSDDDCPFESRRVLVVANVRMLARAAGVLRALASPPLSTTEVAELRARPSEDAATAAQRYASAHKTPLPQRIVRVAVLLPARTPRAAHDACALLAAAALAERDSEPLLEVQTYDDECRASRAYKYLLDALGDGEYGSLSAVAGPACFAPFADVARQSPAHALPVLAYTAQAPVEGGQLQALAAGDARTTAHALASLATEMGWRRLAVLAEAGTRDVVDAMRAHVALFERVELPDEPDLDLALVAQWAARVASSRGRILWVVAEDARVVRAALCAGLSAGLTPAAGTVWLLPATLPVDWLHPRADEECDAEALASQAAGHLSATPEWLATWTPPTVWTSRWRRECRECSCGEPPVHAALLYDTLRLWATALERVLAPRPGALDDLHRPDLVECMLENATGIAYEGVTGRFEWGDQSGARARLSPLVVQQWDGGERRTVRRYEDGRLATGPTEIHWYTADGRTPDDGGEACALLPLADLLHTECRVATGLVAALGVTLAAAMVGGAALWCRRRAERDYRARLAALGLRSLPPGAGLDRWELPRERVVINRKLGVGAFGTVYGGHALLAADRGWTAVAVKTLKAGATTEEKLDFLSEAEAMKRFDHKNVVRLLGVVTKTEPVCTVMEFMLYGDLKSYLLARRHLALEERQEREEREDGGSESAEVSPTRLTAMALDAARALSYLAQQRYVHRDVAARNCLLSARRVLKLADFGMARLVFETDYYRFSRKGMLPVRWMAPESLALGVFSHASDVWSFGVLLYEMVTFGSLPYQGLGNGEVLARVKAGRTLELPAGLKPQLEGLIKSCWQQDSRSRPTAAEVTAFLADCPRLLTPCLDVPLDAMPLDADTSVWRDHAEARWVSWAAPASATTDTTYLSADPPPTTPLGQLETDRFLS